MRNIKDGKSLSTIVHILTLHYEWIRSQFHSTKRLYNIQEISNQITSNQESSRIHGDDASDRCKEVCFIYKHKSEISDHINIDLVMVMLIQF